MPDQLKKILVIDDEPDERLYLFTLLEDNGYETDMAQDGFEGMDKAKSNPPDLITLDITMPKKSGVKFFREIRENPDLKDITIVVVTGVTGLDGNPEDFKKYLSTRENTPPPEGFIPKPIDQEKLLTTVRKLLFA
jgi:CheY-like chemotaxis protein